RKLEGLDQVRLQAPAGPHPLHGGGGDPSGFGHRPAAPVRLALGCGLLGETYDLIDLCLWYLGFATTALAYLAEPHQALRSKASPPLLHRRHRHAELLSGT